MSTPDSGLAASLLQLAQFGERIALLDDREARNFRHVETTLAAVSGALVKLQAAVDGQAAVLESLAGLGESVGLLAAQVTELLPPPEGEPGRGYTPRPSVHWWTIKDEERQKAVARLGAFVEQVFRPHYGHLGAMLGACWEDHPLCLVQLDWASELHSVLYFQPKRSAALLSAQAEFGTRIMPALAEQLGHETRSCTHRRVPAGVAYSSPWAGVR
jgi:hypothetical protein